MMKLLVDPIFLPAASMKGPWHLLARVKGLSFKRLRRTIMKPWSCIWCRRSPGEPWRAEEGNRGTEERRRGGVGPVWLGARSGGAAVLRTRLFSCRWSKSRGWLGRCGARERQVNYQLLSFRCTTICPVNLLPSPRRLPPVFHVLARLFLRGGWRPCIIHSFIFSLSLSLTPFVCALLTFDILLERLAEWPRGFSFCKRRTKTTAVSGKENIQRGNTNSVQSAVRSREAADDSRKHNLFAEGDAVRSVAQTLTGEGSDVRTVVASVKLW